jgi:hypothetical protein
VEEDFDLFLFANVFKNDCTGPRLTNGFRELNPGFSGALAESTRLSNEGSVPIGYKAFPSYCSWLANEYCEKDISWKRLYDDLKSKFS